ncbi:hypothetical protein SH668x_002027 [Planctomicrobium sp. SH668]|uniref:hypothetical protein n=1 Tax=Planctomicrobium sp. SH668 TaxID=3448126 RepID=UPI003F5B1CF7
MNPVKTSHSSSRLYAASAVDVGLKECISRLTTGPWKFIQLRDQTLAADAPETCLTGDDIDLLGSPEAVEQLLSSSLEWVQQRLCHLRIRRPNENKVEFTIFSVDGQQTATFDLWMNLRQVNREKQSLTYEGCGGAISSSHGSIQRLPPSIEASIYLHHILCKRKDLASEKCQRRLLNLVDACRENGEDAFADQLQEVAFKKEISRELELSSLKRIPQASGIQFHGNSISRLWQKWALAVPRKPRHISVIGCDGAGKTTLAEQVSKQQPAVQTFTGKHLYRKSFLYKLAVIFLRPLMRQSRELFDETLAPFVYLRAAIALRMKVLHSSRKTTLIDRSLLDFLFVNRKSDQPSFSRLSWLSNWFGIRIPTVHCIVNYSNVLLRKQEVTAAGHAAYDKEMFEKLSQRIPTDYIAFNNDGSLTESTAAVQEILGTVQGKQSQVDASRQVAAA